MRAAKMLTDLVDCLCESIIEAGVPPVCFCGVVPGSQAAMDYAGTCDDRDGMAWVRQISLYPARGLNLVDDTPSNCAASIGMDIEMGMARRVAVLDEFGNLPGAESYAASSALQNDDALVMLRAVQCCMLDDLGDPIEHVLGSYDPFGPLGGIVGGTWSLAVLLD